MKRFFNPVRYYTYFRARSIRRRLKSVGADFAFDPLSTILDPGLISIGDNVFIGASVVILPGIRIGDNAVVGAGAVLTENIAENSVVAGIPARPKGYVKS